MIDKTEANGHAVLPAASPRQLEDLAGRLAECIDELDALGRYCEANYVALARDLILRNAAVDSLVQPKQIS